MFDVSAVKSGSGAFIKRHRVSIVIFSLAFIARILFALPHFLTPDFSPAGIAQDGYYEIAENILHGHGYSRSHEAPYKTDDVRVPVYPFFILVIIYLTGSYKTFLVFQAVVSSFIPLFGKKIASLCFKDRRVAISTGIFLAIEPHSIWLSSMIFSETLFAFFFLAGCVFFLSFLGNKKTSAIVSASLLFALAMLTRPTIHFFTVFLAALLLWEGRRNLKQAVKNTVLMLAVILAAISPWLLRNYLLFGKPSLSVQAPLVLYANFVPTIVALEEGISFNDARGKVWALLGTETVEDMTIGTAQKYQELMLREIPKYPVGIMKSLWVTFYTFFTHDGLRSVINHHGLFPNEKASQLNKAKVFHDPMIIFSSPAFVAIIVMRIFWLLASIFAFIGLYLFMKEKDHRLFATFAAATVLYFLAVSAVAGLGIDARFRNPVNAFIIMFAFYSLAAVSETKVIHK
jgi:hypothetical protein